MTKSELIQRFGVKFIDALIQYLAEELGKTEQQIVDGIASKLVDDKGCDLIEDYDWCKL